ncbi:unnamed protein product [Protopolystoma xenopodis]|uniref:Uncharacterized protein n=1 Tax=Protopolystoma xenopodis TaxID=117903 RepID=A0A3S5AVG6_9PLAT|nr:unnamed protein product [Protopolystoma xenopodis]
MLAKRLGVYHFQAQTHHAYYGPRRRVDNMTKLRKQERDWDITVPGFISIEHVEVSIRDNGSSRRRKPPPAMRKRAVWRCRAAEDPMTRSSEGLIGGHEQ